MAAFRKGLIRIIPRKEAERHEERVKEEIERYQRQKAHASAEELRWVAPKSIQKLPGRPIRVWEIVATTAEEAASGLFQPVGNILVFIPEKVEDKLWERIHTMDADQNREVWTHPYWGIRQAMKKMHMSIPWEKIRNSRDLSTHFPASLLDQALDQHRVVSAEVQIVSDMSGATKRVRVPESMQHFNPYREFIERVWFPKWLYSSEFSRRGQFMDLRRAQAVAQAFGINVNTKEKKQNWFTTVTTEVLSESERSIGIPDTTFDMIKDRVIKAMESRLNEGETVDPDWDVYLEQFRKFYGVGAKQIIDRLRSELAPIIAQMKAGKWTFDENSPRSRRRSRRR